MSLQLTKSEVIHGRINLKAVMLATQPEGFILFRDNPVTIANVKALYQRTFNKTK